MKFGIVSDFVLRISSFSLAVVIIGATALGAFCFTLHTQQTQEAPTASSAQPSRSVWDGVYTEEQAARGEALYNQECASCHLATLTGGEMAPPLVGAEFISSWNDLTVGDLFERIRVTMPPDRPGRLSRQQNADILAYMLSVNKFPVGKTELAREAHLLKQIRFEAIKP